MALLIVPVISRSRSFFMQVVFQNLSGNDCHFLIKISDLAKQGQKKLSINKEKYISLTKHTQPNMKFRFIHSFLFLDLSLQILVSYLDSKKCFILHKEFSDIPRNNLLTRKSIFNYDYMDKFYNKKK